MARTTSPTRSISYSILGVAACLLFAFRPAGTNRNAHTTNSPACSDYLISAVEDATFNDPDWTSTLIVNRGTPPWTIDFAVQANDSEEIDPITDHYDDPADPPMRYVRFSRNGTADPQAYAMVGTILNKTVVPLGGSVSVIQFDFDNFGGNQRVAPLIYQDETYYEGPERMARRDAGWAHISSGCLHSGDFSHVVQPSSAKPDLSRPMMVGYALAWETSQGFGLRDHLIDNFGVSFDVSAAVVDTSSTNRPPFAINDWTVAEVKDFSVTHHFRVRSNDNDPDGDAVSIVQYDDPLWGDLTPGSIDPIYDGLNIDFAYQAVGLPAVDGPAYDSFRYTISDGEYEASAQSTILFDYACWLESFGPFVPKAVSSDFDLELVRRFRDEAMKPTEVGSLWVDYYYNTAPEILKVMIFDRPDLASRAVAMVESLQPAITNFLDGDGGMPIEQAEIDSISAFFGALREAGSVRLKFLIDTEMERLGPLDDYAGKPVGEVLETVLGEQIETKSEVEVPRTSDFRLMPFPNPFTHTAQISYYLPEPAGVTVSVYDVNGRRVRVLSHMAANSGAHRAVWDGTDGTGSDLPSGVYLVRLATPTQSVSKALILVK